MFRSVWVHALDAFAKKLDDGKVLGGKGRLTEKAIDKIQSYYGMAIRRNLDCVEKMKQDIWAIYFHKLSTDDEPQHRLCPAGENSWCQYKRSLLTGQEYKQNKFTSCMCFTVHETCI